MEQLFFSPNNFNNIRDALDKYSQNKYSRELASDEDNKIHKIMKYVKSKVSDEIPPGYTPQTYNQLMNRKVLDLFVSFKNDEEKQNHKQIVNHPVTKYSSTANSIFDQQLIKNNDIPTDFLPPPSIQNNNQIPITQQLEDVNQQRSELDPKIKNIDFSIKTEENNIDQNKMYQDMIQQRGISANSTPSMLVSDNMPNNIIQPDDGFSNNMNNFQSTNELINKKLDSALEHMESQTNEQYTNIEDLRESDIVDSNMKLNNNDDTAGLPNNLERNNVELVIKKSDDPKNMFYNEDKKVEEALHKINTKTLSEHYETPVILPKQFKTYNDKFYITIDSRDRNLEIYPNPSNFQVKFSPASDSIEKQEVLDSNNNIIYETTVRYLGNLTGASIGRTYSNILELQLLHCIVPFGLGWVCGNSPDSYYDSQCKGSSSSICIPYGPVYTSDTGIAVSILNEPYLLLNIDEFNQNIFTTNKLNVTSVFSTIKDSVPESTLARAYNSMYPYSGKTKTFYPNVLGSLNTLNFHLMYPNGKTYCSDTPINIDNHMITNISYIPSTTTESASFELILDPPFLKDLFRKDDILLIKNFRVLDSSASSTHVETFEMFFNRNEGHSIMKEPESKSGTTEIEKNNFADKLIIASDIRVNQGETGFQHGFGLYDYLKNISSSVLSGSTVIGEVLNYNLQPTFNIIINTMSRDENGEIEIDYEL